MNARVDPITVEPISVVAAAMPLHKPQVGVAPAGLTPAEIAARQNLPIWFWQGGGRIRVITSHGLDEFVSDVVIPVEDWNKPLPAVSPGLKQTVVCEACSLQGGGGGGRGKSAFQVIAMVAIVAVAFAVSAGTGLGTAKFLGAAVPLNKLAAAGISIVGSMAVAALSKPPAVAAHPQADGKPPNVSALQVNILEPGAQLPRVVGTKRVFPPALCPPLAEYVGDDVWTEVVLGLAGPHDIKDVRFNGATPPAGTVPAIRRGLPSDALQTKVTRYGHTDQRDLVLSDFNDSGVMINPQNNIEMRVTGALADANPQKHTLQLASASTTAGGPIDEHWINFNFPAGLFLQATGTPHKQTAVCMVPFRARMRKLASNGVYGNWINLPEFFFARYYTSGFTMSLRILWRRPSTKRAAPPTDTGGIYAFTNVKGQTDFTVQTGTTPPTTIKYIVTPKTPDWQAHSYFIDPARRSGAHACYSAANYASSDLINMIGKSDRWEVYLDPNTFAQGRYELEIIRGTAMVKDDFTPTTHFHSMKVASGTGSRPPYPNDLFSYYIIPKQALPDGGTLFGAGLPAVRRRQGMVAQVGIPTVSAVINGQPSPNKNVACIAIRAKNIGNIGAISARCSGLVNDWNGSSWSNLTATSNPAPHARDIYVGNLNARPATVDQIDDDDFLGFRTRCAAKGYKCDAEIRGGSVPENFALVTGWGFGGPRNAERFGVTWEYDRSSEGPVQIFTPANMRDLRINKPFPHFPDGLRLLYSDGNNDDQDSSFIEWYGSKRSTLEEVRYEGGGSFAAVLRRARFDLRQARLRSTQFTWISPIEYLRCRKGDLVGIQSDILASQSGWGRIQTLTLNGGSTQITRIKLDRTIPAFASVSSGGVAQFPVAGLVIAIQRANGDVTSHAVTLDTDLRTLILTSSIAVAPNDIREGCVVSVQGYRRVIVHEITPKDAMSAEIVARDEAPQLAALID